MALKFNPFEQDKAVTMPVTRKHFSKLKVFDDPPAATPKDPGAGTVVAPQVSQLVSKEAPVLESVAKKNESELRANWEQNGNKTAVYGAVSLLTGLQRSALFHIVEMCKVERSQISPPLTSKRLGELIQTASINAKDVIKCLIHKNLMVVENSKKGRGGWSQYRVPDLVSQEVFYLLQEGKLRANREQIGSESGANPGSISSNTLKTTTTAAGNSSSDKAMAEMFLLFLERFGFADTLGPADMLELWRSGVFRSPEELIESVEHIAFYLHSPEAKGIESPKAYAMRRLRGGFYAQPNNFRSWEVRQEDAKIAAKKQRTAQLAEVRRESFMAEFEEWAVTQDTTQRQTILKDRLGEGIGFAPKHVLRATLLKHFAQEKGEFELLDERAHSSHCAD